MLWPTSLWLSGLLAVVLVVVPGPAGASDRGSGESLRSERGRATEALNRAADRHASLSARERAILAVGGEAVRGNRQVQVTRPSGHDRPAYVYEVDGQRRVSVAEPRRVERQPVRVQDRQSQLAAIERAAAERAALYNIPRSASNAAEVRDSGNATARGRLAGHETEAVLQEVASYPYPQATFSHASQPSFEARHRAEAAVRHASHRRHIQREVYAGYRHTPSSRLTTSIHLHSGHASASYRYHESYYHAPPVRVYHHYYYPSRPHWGTTIRYHHGSRFHCPPVRRHHHHHHHHHRSGGRVSLHLRF